MKIGNGVHEEEATIPCGGFKQRTVLVTSRQFGGGGTVQLVGRFLDRFPVVSHWGFFSVATDGTMCPGFDSASNNEYQGFPLGVKAAAA
jgi:hypothetical protein